MDNKISQFQGRLKTLLRRATPPKRTTARFRSKPNSRVSHWLTNMELSVISENNVSSPNTCLFTFLRKTQIDNTSITNLLTNQKQSIDMERAAQQLLQTFSKRIIHQSSLDQPTTTKTKELINSHIKRSEQRVKFLKVSELKVEHLG